MPSSLDHVAQFPREMYCSDGVYLYGRSSDTQRCCRINISDESITDVHNFGTGFNVGEGFIDEETGTIFFTVKVNATNLHSLYRSDDLGVTFTKVLEIGNRGGIHTANIRLLDAFRPITLNGVRAIFTSEYDTSSSSDHDLQILKSVDDGVNWVVVAVHTESRHCHSISLNPYTNELYIAYGDTDFQSGIIVWNGVDDWPTNSTWADIHADSNFKAVNDGQQYRALNIVFTERYAFSMADTTQQVDAGIYRYNHDLTDNTKVDTSVNDFNNSTLDAHDGWYGLVLSNGDVVFIDSPRSGSTNYFIAVYSSSDEENFEVIGKIYKRTTATVSDPRWFGQIGDRVYISTPAIAGYDDKNTVSWEIGKEFNLSDPDTLSPVYHVDSGGSDANSGQSKQKAFATISNAVTSNKMTHGAKVKIASGTHVLATETFAIQSNTYPADDVSKTIFEGAGSNLTRINASQQLTIQASDGDIELRDCRVTTGSVFNESGYDGALTENINIGKRNWQ